MCQGIDQSKKKGGYVWGRPGKDMGNGWREEGEKKGERAKIRLIRWVGSVLLREMKVQR
jgi:hypothetical protein